MPFRLFDGTHNPLTMNPSYEAEKMKKILVLLLFGVVVSGSVFGGTRNAKRAFLWLDAEANFERLGTAAKAEAVLDSIKEAGFTDVIVDLKGTPGSVLYPSTIATVLQEYKGTTRAPEYDYPAVMQTYGHKLGLKVFFSLNIFSEGDKEKHIGLANTVHPEWQVQVYTKDGIVPIVQSSEELSAFVNPALPEVRKYELAIIKEVARRYRPDGIVLDRVRFPNISGDFSAVSKALFEKSLGKKITRWPEDVYALRVSAGGTVTRVPGPYYRKWLHWRAGIIHDFVLEVRKTIKATSPRTAFGDYVGAWYPIYDEVGVNWASKRYDPSKEYDWAEKGYGRTGYAELLDNLFVGTYFYEVAPDEAVRSHTPSPDSSKTPDYYWWYSVEGSGRVAMKAVKKAVPTYGSLYVQQYLDKQNPEQFVKAMRQAFHDTDGLMIFDLIHLSENGWWKYIKEAMTVQE